MPFPSNKHPRVPASAGKRIAKEMPWPLQERFASRLASIPDGGQQDIDRALKQVVDMMEAREIDAWPIIGAGIWSEAAERKRSVK